MKIIPFAILLALPLILTAAEVRTGDNLGEVRAALGVPNGQLRIGDRHLLYYDRGEIELQSGTVTRVALLSDADYAVLEVRRGQMREEQEVRRTRLSAEGEALKTRMLADPAFQAAPLAYQVAFWENFSRRYPEVSGTEHLTIARLRLAEQRRTQVEQEQRLADLEARVAEAEARAAEATLYRGQAYYSYGGGYAQHPFSLWPVDYRFNDIQPPYITTTGRRYLPGTDNRYRIERRMTDRFDFMRRGSTNRDYDFNRRHGTGGMRNRF